MRYLLLTLLAALALAAPAEAQGTRYTTTALRLRSAPATLAEIVARMPRGSAVSVSNCDAGWCAVTYSGTPGYASEEHLSSTAPSYSGRSSSGGSSGS